MSAQSRDMMKVQFPQPWYESIKHERPLSHVQEIEVRKLPNSPDNEFLFAALPNGDNYYSHEWDDAAPKPEYSENFFVVNFTSTPRARAATKQEWESATRIVTQPRLAVKHGDNVSGEIEYRGKKFQKGGKYWHTGWLSPRGRWLATFSYTGERTRDFAFMDGGSVRDGDIFWQVYDTVTGEKVFEWQARGVKSPTSFSGPVVWLEERYFLFPQDLEAQNFIVVTLPEFVPEKNPITIQLPSRTDANGGRVPAPTNHPVWTPLVPLTKEQAAKLTAPQPPQLVEVRSPQQFSSRELLIAIKEETENGLRHQPARGFEGAADYNYRLFSTYYFAISLDDPTQSRFASKEEWDSGRVLRSSRTRISLDTMIETPMGKRRAFRPFPKTGTTWGSPMQSSGDWIAVFSYTPDAGASRAGKMFVDIFERLEGNKFSSTEFPYTGSADALFNSAMWIEDDYLIVPLNTSIDSFILWKLP